MSHNAMETTKNIHSVKDDECTVELSIVTKWLKEFCLGCMNIDDQARSGRYKTVDS